MTEENYLYRTSPRMLRNQFPGMGTWHIPIIPKSAFSDEDFTDLRLIGFDRTKSNDYRHTDRMVHFFLYDYKFERVWKQPEQVVERLSPYRAVLSPDFSMYLEMNPVMQLYNVFRNRWCGAYLAEKGLRVIPTVSWGDETTFDFCFEGIPKGSTVAVSTYMVSEHGHHANQKDFFMKGYRELLRRVEPERIICYNEPFPEMEGNIVYVNYELSSWKYQNEEYIPSKYLPYICGKLPLPAESTLRVKSGYVLRDRPFGKGMGSAYGGAWKPNPAKKQDMILIGPANEIRSSHLGPIEKGYDVSVKYGPDGLATIIRHHTEHSPGSGHSNPHDHIVDWSSPDHHPHIMPPTNYPDGNPPELKSILRRSYLMDIMQPDESLQFHSISEFTTSMRYGAEVVIEWNGIEYGIWSEDGSIRITCPSMPEQNCTYQAIEDVLNHMIGALKLREIITQVTVLDRTI